MAYEFSFTFPLVNGLHARPATALAEAAAQWKSAIELHNKRTSRSADAKSVLELVAAGVGEGDLCRLSCNGDDADLACAGLAQFIAERLVEADAPLPVQPATSAGKLPRQLASGTANIVTGQPASPGLGRGVVVQARTLELPAALAQAVSEDPGQELNAVATAFKAVIQSMQARPSTGNAVAEDIAKALQALVSDPALQNLVREQIERNQATAGQAIVAAIEQFSARLRQSGSTYLQERIADLQDIGLQLLAELPGVVAQVLEINLAGPSIVLAANLSAAQLLSLDRSQLRGLVLSDAGLTSHVVILARSFGIPCVVGVRMTELSGLSGDAVIDGAQGFIAGPVNEVVQRYFDREQELSRRIALRAAAGKGVESRTTDGRRVEIAANISTAPEAATARSQGADGIGLFRTELLFSMAQTEPPEQEQFAVYTAAAKAMHGAPVIIRTLDVGGDKPLPYLDLPREENPFLGLRGIRVYQRHLELFTRQLRAIIRASADGNVWVMAPMVGSREEAVWFRQQVREQQEALKLVGAPFDPAMPVGIMVEVPAVALIVDALCDVVDFFSVGTNDLTQYLLAVERGNPLVAATYQELHPALVRMLKQIVDQAHSRGRWVGLCGELAANPRYAPLLIGLGFDELSMSIPAIPGVQAAVAACDSARCREFVQQALQCGDAASIQALLDTAGVQSAEMPLTAAELVELDSDSRNKAEAIRELCMLNVAAGRSQDTDELEDAVWAREETYSTGLGHAIAIPHCKSATVRAASLALLRLARPVDWGSLDNQPVDTVLLLTMPAKDAAERHLRVFAALARKLMHESFRRGLRTAEDAARMVAFLSTELEQDLTEGQEHE